MITAISVGPRGRPAPRIAVQGDGADQRVVVVEGGHRIEVPLPPAPAEAPQQIACAELQ
jgi:hypothetical protein